MFMRLKQKKVISVITVRILVTSISLLTMLAVPYQYRVQGRPDVIDVHKIHVCSRDWKRKKKYIFGNIILMSNSDEDLKMLQGV